MTAPKDRATILYGKPGAEHLHDDPAAVWEDAVDSVDHPSELVPFEIVEHDIVDPVTHLPSADTIAEWLCEQLGEHGELACEVYESWHDTVESDKVTALIEQLRHDIADNVMSVMANNELRTMIVTLDDNNKPLLDGQPMYVPARIPGQNPLDFEVTDPDISQCIRYGYPLDETLYATREEVVHAALDVGDATIGVPFELEGWLLHIVYSTESVTRSEAVQRGLPFVTGDAHIVVTDTGLDITFYEGDDDLDGDSAVDNSMSVERIEAQVDTKPS